MIEIFTYYWSLLKCLRYFGHLLSHWNLILKRCEGSYHTSQKVCSTYNFIQAKKHTKNVDYQTFMNCAQQIL